MVQLLNFIFAAVFVSHGYAVPAGQGFYSTILANETMPASCVPIPSSSIPAISPSPTDAFNSSSIPAISPFGYPWGGSSDAPTVPGPIAVPTGANETSSGGFPTETGPIVFPTGGDNGSSGGFPTPTGPIVFPTGGDEGSSGGFPIPTGLIVFPTTPGWNVSSLAGPTGTASTIPVTCYGAYPSANA